MPTDGTLLLENIPRSKQYLVTALSVFFSIGAVLAAVVALVTLPSHSCPPLPAECDVQKVNNGWRYLLGVLGAIVSVHCSSSSAYHLTSPDYLHVYSSGSILQAV
jgi:MFS family permease